MREEQAVEESSERHDGDLRVAEPVLAPSPA
jgi:hypothetical protein